MLYSGKIYTDDKNFTRPPVVTVATVATNLNSACGDKEVLSARDQVQDRESFSGSVFCAKHQGYRGDTTIAIFTLFKNPIIIFFLFRSNINIMM